MSGKPRIILITGSGLGKTLLRKLLADAYRKNRISCQEIAFPGEPLNIDRNASFVIIDALSGSENHPEISALNPWQTIMISGAFLPPPPGEFLSIPSVSEPLCNIHGESDCNPQPCETCLRKADQLLSDLYFCLRSMIHYIEMADPPLEHVPSKKRLGEKLLITETPDFRLSQTTLKEAESALRNLRNIETMTGS